MPWVIRDRTGAVSGLFGVQQSFTTEFLEDTNLEVIAYLHPAPAFASTSPSAIAAAFNINVANGDITNIEGMFNIVAGAYIDVGVYMLFFSTSAADANYFAVINGNAPSKEMTDHTTDYFVIESRDSVGGAHIDPPQTSVQIFRIAT